MKIPFRGTTILIAVLGTFFFVSGEAISDNTASPQTTPETQSVSVKAKHPLAMAQQQLADEIKQLQEKINTPVEEHKYSLSRIWHRSKALAAREIDNLTKSWNESSTANQTLKHIIDAKMRFSDAEHDLFVKHDAEKARVDIDSTLAYLDKANETAPPSVRQKINSLKKVIQQLPTNNTHSTETQAIIQALDSASTSVDKVSRSSNSNIQARGKKIANEIISLRKRHFYLGETSTV